MVHDQGACDPRKMRLTRPLISRNVGFKLCAVPEGDCLRLKQERFLEKGEHLGRVGGGATDHNKQEVQRFPSEVSHRQGQLAGLSKCCLDDKIQRHFKA